MDSKKAIAGRIAKSRTHMIQTSIVGTFAVQHLLWGSANENATSEVPKLATLLFSLRKRIIQEPSFSLQGNYSVKLEQTTIGKVVEQTSKASSSPSSMACIKEAATQPTPTPELCCLLRYTPHSTTTTLPLRNKSQEKLCSGKSLFGSGSPRVCSEFMVCMEMPKSIAEVCGQGHPPLGT